MAGNRSNSPADAFKEIAHWIETADATAPISITPKGVPVPMHTLSRPIIRPRIS